MDIFIFPQFLVLSVGKGIFGQEIRPKGQIAISEKRRETFRAISADLHYGFPANPETFDLVFASHGKRPQNRFIQADWAKLLPRFLFSLGWTPTPPGEK